MVTKLRKLQFLVMPLTVMMLAAFSNVRSQAPVHIEATAMGTSTQLGRVVNIDLRIREFSTAEDQKILLGVFEQKGSEGLANALEKMKAKGRIAITGTVGYDLNYIRQFKMRDGSRRIRFITDRAIRFNEAWYDTRTMDYQLSMGEVIIPASKVKSSGTLMPVALLRVTKRGEVEIENYQNPWKLTNIRIRSHGVR